VYQPRGIGLGYYEDMKTIGIMAILNSFNPISVYGDQGLLPVDVGQMAVGVLRSYGFIIKDHKDYSKQQIVKWSGYTMSRDKLAKRSTYWDGIFGAFSAQEHWERKSSLRSVSELMDDYKLIDDYIAFHYERTFGPEFTRGDSYNHFDNSGVTLSSPYQAGFRKEWRVDMLKTPQISYESNVFHQSPFHIEVNRKESKEFSKIRWKAYKYSRVESTEMLEYVYPRISMNGKPNRHLSRFGALLPWWADLKLVLEHGATSGTITSGLTGDELVTAAINQKFAPDPFKARATGGYKILTQYRSMRTVSKEMYVMATALSELSLMSSYSVKRYDVPLGPADIWRPEFVLYDYLVDQGQLVPPGGLKRPAPLSSMSRSSRRKARAKRIKHESKYISDGNFSISDLSDLLLGALEEKCVPSTEGDTSSSDGDEQNVDELLYADVDLGQFLEELP
jgi:hypothetical protein